MEKWCNLFAIVTLSFIFVNRVLVVFLLAGIFIMDLFLCLDPRYAIESFISDGINFISLLLLSKICCNFGGIIISCFRLGEKKKKKPQCGYNNTKSIIIMLPCSFNGTSERAKDRKIEQQWKALCEKKNNDE